MKIDGCFSGISCHSLELISWPVLFSASNVQLDLDFFVKKTAWSYPAAYTATSPTAGVWRACLGDALPPPSSSSPRYLLGLAG